MMSRDTITPNRRSLLGAISLGAGASLTGCVGTIQSVAGDCSPDLAAPDTDPPEDGFPEIAVDVRQFENSALRADARVVEQFSADSPARIEVAHTNTAGTARTLQYGGTGYPVSRTTGDHVDRDASVHLSTSEAGRFRREREDTDKLVYPEDPIEGCWQVDMVLLEDMIPGDETLGACDSITETYELFADADNSGCLPAGTYEFENSVEVNDDEQEWGLTVEVLE